MMRSQLIFRRVIVPGATYAVAAAFSIGLTRVGDGFAMFWIATALLIPVLTAWPVRRWWPTLAACWVGSVVATGLVGFGWHLAPFLATANCAEAAIAALLLRAAHRRYRSYVSLQWMGLATIGGGVIAPLLSGLVSIPAIVWLTDLPATELLADWMISHGMGFVSLFPIAGLLAQARMRHRLILPEKGKRLTAAAALVAVIVSGVLCFGQSTVPMLFLPILVLMYTMVLTDLTVSAVAMFLFLVMGVGSTYLGVGPLQLMAVEPSVRWLFLQLYIVCIAVTAIPIALLLEKRRTMFDKLVQSEARYRLLADYSDDIIMVTGTHGAIQFISPSVRQMGDYDAAALLGMGSEMLVAAQHRAEIIQAHRRVMSNPGATASVEFLGITRSNVTRWMEAHMRGIFREDGAVDGVCSIIRDISRRKRRESELHAVSLTDPLTKLANRPAFEAFMATVGKDDGESHIALFDLDHLKQVNADFGHHAGDIVISAFARAARSAMGNADMVARICGEKFAVYLHDTTVEQTQRVCERIRAAFLYETKLAAPQVGPVSASVGVSRCDGPLAAVMRRAEAALFEAKAKGRDSLSIAA